MRRISSTLKRSPSFLRTPRKRTTPLSTRGTSGVEAACRTIGTDEALAPLASRLGLDFFRDDFEAGEPGKTEARRDGDVIRITSRRHQDSAYARLVMPCIKGEPMAAEIGLEPCVEIHGIRHRRHPDVAEIAGAISRRNVHVTAA
ncbi:hypothetical protein BQ8794_290125 [Mesorhizobium prunaredense]|uniref:Uncharacterized protein n=1 Tax=Mesorhizobium prunaredense TaxID=1631249 RepID=A0A1R3V9B0_9HYPH|nr:hypothetical protein BQ8794_290125 [Mesorhizobium prunaredense]